MYPSGVGASFVAAGGFNGSANTNSLTVGKATPLITWNNPADITYGTALSATQLDATTTVAGSFVYNPVSGTVLHSGNSQALSTTFTPSDTTNYNSANKNVSINVLKKGLTATAQDKSKTYRAVNPALTYTLAGFVNADTTQELKSKRLKKRIVCPTWTYASGIRTISPCRRAPSGLPGRLGMRIRRSGSAAPHTACSVTWRRRARTSRRGSSCSLTPSVCSRVGTGRGR